MRNLALLLSIFFVVDVYAATAKESMDTLAAEEEKVGALAGCAVAYKMMADITGNKEDKLSVAEIDALAQETIVGSKFDSLVRKKYQESLLVFQNSLQSRVSVLAAIGGTQNEYAAGIAKAATPYLESCLPYMEMIELKGGGTIFTRRN